MIHLGDNVGFRGWKIAWKELLIGRDATLTGDAGVPAAWECERIDDDRDSVPSREKQGEYELRRLVNLSAGCGKVKGG
jgi:hypothetical protein